MEHSVAQNRSIYTASWTNGLNVVSIIGDMTEEELERIHAILEGDESKLPKNTGRHTCHWDPEREPQNPPGIWGRIRSVDRAGGRLHHGFDDYDNRTLTMRMKYR